MKDNKEGYLSDTWMTKFSQRAMISSMLFSSCWTSTWSRLIPGRVLTTSCFSVIKSCCTVSMRLWLRWMDVCMLYSIYITHQLHEAIINKTLYIYSILICSLFRKRQGASQHTMMSAKVSKNKTSDRVSTTEQTLWQNTGLMHIVMSRLMRCIFFHFMDILPPIQWA